MSEFDDMSRLVSPDDVLLAQVTGALIAYGSHPGAQRHPVDAAQKIIAMVRRFQQAKKAGDRD